MRIPFKEQTSHPTFQPPGHCFVWDRRTLQAHPSNSEKRESRQSTACTPELPNHLMVILDAGHRPKKKDLWTPSSWQLAPLKIGVLKCRNGDEDENHACSRLHVLTQLHQHCQIRWGRAVRCASTVVWTRGLDL